MSGGGGYGCTSTPSSAATARSVVLSELLGHIHGHYKATLDRLPVEEMPVLIPRLLDAGTVSSSSEPLPEPNAAAQGKEEAEDRSKRGRKRKRTKATAAEARRRRRDAAMSEITTDTSSISRLPPILRGGKIRKRRTVAQRSLEGIVTFLVCYFRHLPFSEALHYLLLAKADLLAAVHLIDRSGGMGDRSCPISSPTSLIALRCAAMSASLPEPAILATRLLSLTSHPEQLSQLPSIGRCLSPDGINRLHKLLEEPLDHLGESRDIKGTNSLIELPTDALRRRDHRGLLKAGICFGPVDDPVSNIILNTIWYECTAPHSPHL